MTTQNRALLEVTWLDDSKTIVDTIKRSAVYSCDGELAIDVTHADGRSETLKGIKYVLKLRK